MMYNKYNISDVGALPLICHEYAATINFSTDENKKFQTNIIDSN